MRYAYRVTFDSETRNYGTTRTIEELKKIKKHAIKKGYTFESWELVFKEIEV